MALFRNLCVNLQDFWFGVLQYASAQSLDILDLTKNCSFLNWKLQLRHPEFPGWTATEHFTRYTTHQMTPPDQVL